jgi:hypothetical protein
MSHSESRIAIGLLTGQALPPNTPVSARFLDGVQKAHAIYKEWGLHTTLDVSRYTPVAHRHGGQRVAAFFTLGVDSFCTLLQHRDEIDDLIYVIGFERKIQDQILDNIIESIQKVAAYFHKNAVFVSSNLRDEIDPHVAWYRYGHGPALASIGLEREDQYRKIYIPASNTLSCIQKCATHPHIDHLWSTETLEFVHDNPITRVEKVQIIGQHSQYALDHIRVCYQGTHIGNCSICEKCVRTMLTIYGLGFASSAFGALPSLDHINMISQNTQGSTNWPLWMQNFTLFKHDEQMLKALTDQL